MTAALLTAFLLITALTAREIHRHTPHRHYRHRLHRPEPYTDLLRHLIAPGPRHHRGHRENPSAPPVRPPRRPRPRPRRPPRLRARAPHTRRPTPIARVRRPMPCDAEPARQQKAVTLP